MCKSTYSVYIKIVLNRTIPWVEGNLDFGFTVALRSVVSECLFDISACPNATDGKEDPISFAVYVMIFSQSQRRTTLREELSETLQAKWTAVSTHSSTESKEASSYTTHHC